MAQQTKSRSNSGKSTGTAKKSASNSGSTKATAKSTEQPMGEELEKLFIDSLKDIYYAEKALTKALPKMGKAATTPELQQAFEEHTAQTQEQVARLEQVFELLGKKPQAKKCEAMEGLQKEAETIIEETTEGTLTRDVGLIMAAQKVEHYEIATYGGLAQLATTFGLSEIADLLQQTLDEEKETDENLTYIAENNVNYEAGQEGEEETDEDKEA